MTKAQRATAIAEAILNRVPTQEEVTRMVEAFWNAEEEGTAAEKLNHFLSRIRYFLITKIKDAETHAGVLSVQASVGTQVETDFAESE